MSFAPYRTSAVPLKLQTPFSFAQFVHGRTGVADGGSEAVGMGEAVEVEVGEAIGEDEAIGVDVAIGVDEAIGLGGINSPSSTL
jgi:hypothetical protein